MCNKTCIDFGHSVLKEEEIKGKAVIEVGSIDINGSLRAVIEKLHPGRYVGVDIQPGPGVDEICYAEDLVGKFGRESFDALIATELLEHVRDWRRAISNFKNILRPGGVLVITTRSKGFSYHDFPFDYWRYEINDMKEIFSDFIVEVMQKDPLCPGLLFKAKKPLDFKEKDTTKYRLYSIITKSHTEHIADFDIRIFKIRFAVKRFIWRMMPAWAKRFIEEKVTTRYDFKG